MPGSATLCVSSVGFYVAKSKNYRDGGVHACKALIHQGLVQVTDASISHPIKIWIEVGACLILIHVSQLWTRATWVHHATAIIIEQAGYDVV